MLMVRQTIRSLPSEADELIAGGETSNPSINSGIRIDDSVTVYNNNLAYRVEG